MSELENQKPIEPGDGGPHDSPAPEVVATEAAADAAVEATAEPTAEGAAEAVDAAPVEPVEAEAPDAGAEPETSESAPQPEPVAAAVSAEAAGGGEVRAEDDAAAVSVSADAEPETDAAEEVQVANGPEETAAEEADEVGGAEPVEEAPAVEEAGPEQADGSPEAAEAAPAEAAEQAADDGADTAVDDKDESADAAETDEGADAAEAAPEAPKPAGIPGIDWYIIHTYSGFENKVKESLRTRADAFGFADRIGEILIPTEDVVEMRSGKKVTSKRLLYPGYVLLQLKMDDELWHVVKNTPRVTGFVGGDPSPTPLTADEVNQILYRQSASKEKPRPKMSFEHNDRVKIIDGPFANFTGTVEEINPDRSTLKVMVTIFGRGTPVELEYFQVEQEKI